MATVEDIKVELGFGRKPAKRTLSASGKWKQFSAAAHDYVSTIYYEVLHVIKWGPVTYVGLLF